MSVWACDGKCRTGNGKCGRIKKAGVEDARVEISGGLNRGGAGGYVMESND